MARATTLAFRYILGAAALLFAAFLPAHLPGGLPPAALADATFNVDSTGDESDAVPGDGTCAIAPGGPCTLRAAIIEANASPGRNTIAFRLTGLRTISPTSPLPPVVEAVAIDGTTQLGFSGRPLVELDGSLAGATSGLVLDGGNSVVKGLAINQFGSYGILIRSDDNAIQGNFIGTDSLGKSDHGNKDGGIAVWVTLNGWFNNQIGGREAADRNLISGNDGYGIFIPQGGNRVEGNYIGTDVSGKYDLGNSADGIVACACTTTVYRRAVTMIGAPDAGAGNLISGNGESGIYTDGGIVAQGNMIGTDVTGRKPLGNRRAGIDAGGYGLSERQQ